jgi:polyphosphate kinase
VEVDLLVRGICCLRPGVKGVSDNIRVRAVIDRFLEHSRVFHFKNGGSDEVYLSSADWMPRNFRRRVEVMWPILDEGLRRRAIEEILGGMLADSAKSWMLSETGSYSRVQTDGKGVRSQYRFIELARERAREIEGPRGKSLATAQAPAAAMEKLRRKKKKKRRKRGED